MQNAKCKVRQGKRHLSLSGELADVSDQISTIGNNTWEAFRVSNLNFYKTCPFLRCISKVIVKADKLNWGAHLEKIKRSLAMEHISKWFNCSTLMMTMGPERNQTYYGSKHNSETIQFANGARVADLEILIFKWDRTAKALEKQWKQNSFLVKCLWFIIISYLFWLCRDENWMSETAEGSFDSLGLKDYGCHRSKVNENKRSKNK